MMTSKLADYFCDENTPDYLKAYMHARLVENDSVINEALNRRIELVRQSERGELFDDDFFLTQHQYRKL